MMLLLHSNNFLCNCAHNILFEHVILIFDSCTLFGTIVLLEKHRVAMQPKMFYKNCLHFFKFYQEQPYSKKNMKGRCIPDSGH